MTDPTPTYTLLVGTNNAHKAGEIAALLAPLGIAVTTPRDLGIDEEPVEDGATFAENALIKARFYSALAGLPALADDSGLVVDALQGRPGIFSSRYAPSDPERIARLLDEIRAVPDDHRAARFVCAAALVVPRHLPPSPAVDVYPPQERGPRETGGTPVLLSRAGEWVREGRCEGRIAHAPRGAHGFGYDPVFLVADLGFAKTMAELSPDEKNRLSHRARALAAMMELFAARG